MLFLSFKLLGQKECGVNVTSPVYVSNSKAFTSYTFKVYYHIIRKNNGSNPSASITDVANAHNILNSNYISGNICFVLSAIDFIDDTDYYNYMEEDEDDLFDTDTHSDGIDVYIIRDRGKKSPYNGTANSLPGNKIIILNSKIQESTLSHEMGHVLGLYHTFEQSICAEAEDGSNADQCGDLVEDTPANSYECRYLTNTCEYPCSVTYNVDALLNNFMIYADELYCRTVFTEGQIDRMHAMIDQTADLQQRLVTPNRTIAFLNIPFSIPLGGTINDIVQEAKGFLTLQDVNIQAPGKGAFRAEEEIIVLPGFDALEGCRALLIIENICRSGETQAKAVESVVEFYENEGLRIDLSDDELTEMSEQVLQSEFNNSELTVFPNPFSEVFTISVVTNEEYNENELVAVEISDLNGKQISFFNYTYGQLSRDIDINTIDLKQGFYILKVSIGEVVFISGIVKE